MSRKPTMTDVAREAGVSLSAVDRVLNDRGGVQPEKARAILNAARRLGLDRALATRPARSLRVAVLIQPPGNPFHAELRRGLQLAARLYADRNMQFLVHHIDPNDPARVAAVVAAQGRQCDGLIITGPDDPRVAAALRQTAVSRPVVTLADDITDSGRSAYVGPDDRRAGRVAGDLMGKILWPQGGEVVMVIGLASKRGHREREIGFRSVLAEYYPDTVVAGVIETREEPDRAGLLVDRALTSAPDIRGIYHCTAGTQQVVDALRRRRQKGRTVLVVHELTANRRLLLRQRAIDAVIDQHAALEAQVAVETMARLLGRMGGDPISTVVEMRVYLPENA
jgi:LacI family transcriptional regulator